MNIASSQRDTVERSVERRNEERIPRTRVAYFALAAQTSATTRTVVEAGLLRPKRGMRARARFAACSPMLEMRVALRTTRASGTGAGTTPRAAGRACRSRASTSASKRCCTLSASRKAGAVDEIDELGAARQKHVLTVVDFDAVDFERGRAAAEQAAAFEELDVRRRARPNPPPLPAPRGRLRRRLCAAESHDFTMTRSFSVFASAAR